MNGAKNTDPVAIYRVVFDGIPEFAPGADGDAVAFLNPGTFKDSEWAMQQIMHRWCTASDAS